MVEVGKARVKVFYPPYFIASGTYDVIIEGRQGVVTGFKNLNPKALENLAVNYGWK
jgi:hypothetical protein